MWDLERADDGALPLYLAAAVLDAQRWLRQQQAREGLTHADDRGFSWTLSARLAGRYFGVAQYPSAVFGPAAQDSLLILAKPSSRWAETREVSDIPSANVAQHPLLWFAAIPWRAHLSKNRDHLVLFCPDHRMNWRSFPAWTLTLPISLPAWRLLHADYQRHQKAETGRRQVSRFALGDGAFVPVLGFDVEWGSVVNVPVRIDPLIEEMRMLSHTERVPVFSGDSPAHV